MKIVLVQMTEKQWTMPAVHLACALARSSSANIILLQLIQEPHPSNLKQRFSFVSPPPQHDDIGEYAATAEDYGVHLSVRFMQCLSPLEALSNAADQLNADVVFAYVPQSWLPYWRKFQTWHLQRSLAAAHRQLFVLDQAALDQLPSIVTKPDYLFNAK